jgi:hypothetical protein
MKKDRNSFFTQYGYSYANNYMQPNMNNMNYPNYQSYNPETDFESRISKLESENKLLDSRISKLESTIPKITNNTDYNFANSMYMV